MSILSVIENDLKLAWGVLTGKIEADALILWSDTKAVVTSLVPAEYAIFKSLVQVAKADITNGDLAALETAVLNAAEAGGHAFVSAIENSVLKALIALLATL